MNTSPLDNPVLEKLSRTALHLGKNPPKTKADMNHALRVLAAALEQLASWSLHTRPGPRPAALDKLNTVCETLVEHFHSQALTKTLFVASMGEIKDVAKTLDDWARNVVVFNQPRCGNVIAFPVKSAWPACAQPSFNPRGDGDAA